MSAIVHITIRDRLYKIQDGEVSLWDGASTWKPSHISSNMLAREGTLATKEEVIAIMSTPTPLAMLAKCGDVSATFKYPHTCYKSHKIFDRGELISEVKQRRAPLPGPETVWVDDVNYRIQNHNRMIREKP